ncbi:hypothetical protein MTE1_5362 [Klebsiella pneumoniae JHCK1]|nr:hypothetical protein MTE1_5362 [Klebsiella pneumoniae JHCK1]
MLLWRLIEIAGKRLDNYIGQGDVRLSQAVYRFRLLLLCCCLFSQRCYQRIYQLLVHRLFSSTFLTIHAV